MLANPNNEGALLSPSLSLVNAHGRSITGKYSLNPLPNTAVIPTTAPRLSLTPAGPTSAVRPLGKMAVPICHPRMPGH